jgi:hypothetical protein
VVGRDLPNLCPHGEDHQGRRGASSGRGGSGRKQFGSKSRLGSRSLIVMIQIHKALVWLMGRKDLLVIL